MPTVSYALSSFTNLNDATMYAGDTFSAYASGLGVANAFITAARLTLKNIKVYSSQCYLDINKGSATGSTAVLAQNSNIHNQTVNLTSYVNALAQTGAGTLIFTLRVTNGSTANLINLRADVSGTLELDYFVPVSNFTLSASEVTLNSDNVNITATITPAHTSALHDVTLQFVTPYGNYTLNQYDTASHSTPFDKTFSIAPTWLTAIPNSESGVATVRVDTYVNAALTGSVTLQFLIKAHTLIKPSITGLTPLPIRNGEPSGWNEYVQGYTGVHLAATGINGIHGSTITEVRISGGGYSVTVPQSTPVYDTGIVNLTGTVMFTCTVTDSRNRTNTAIAIADYRAYSPPQLTSLMAVRCSDTNGTELPNGTYVKLMATYTVSSVNGKNGMAGMVTKHRLFTSDPNTYITPSIDTAIHTSGLFYVIGPGFDANTSYVVQVTLQDGITTGQASVTVPTQKWLLHYRAGGRGVAVGQAATVADAFEVASDWKLRAYGREIGVPCNPNLLINGDFRNYINQRGGYDYTTHGGYTVDRWQYITPAGGGHLYADPNGYVHLYAPTGGSSYMLQWIEYPKSYIGDFTLTFYAAIIGGTIGIYGNDGISALGYTIFTGYQGYKEYSTTFHLDGAQASLFVAIQASSGGSVAIKWVKLEAGPTSTPFTPRPYQQELALCQRYYLKLPANRFVYSLTDGTQYYFVGCMMFPVPMRVDPTISLTTSTVSNVGLPPTYGVYSKTLNGIFQTKCTLASPPYTGAWQSIGGAADAEIY